MTKGRLARRSSDNYTLIDIERAYKSRELLYIYAMQGDMDSIHLLVDAGIALEKANPTTLQTQTIELVWAHGYTLVEAGKELEVTPQAVKFNLDLLKVKIKRVLDLWDVINKRGGAS